MTTSGELISSAIRYAVDEANKTARDGIEKLEQVGVTIGHLTFAVTRLADQLGQPEKDEPREDGESFRMPAAAWPRMKSMTTVAP